MAAGKYQAYPKYDDPDINWLQAKPIHWSRVRMDGYATTIKDQVSPNDIADEIVTHYSIPTIQEIGIGRDEHGETIDSNKFIVRKGDVLFSKLNPRKETISTVHAHQNRSVASTEMVVLRLKEGCGDFLAYLLKGQELKSFICSQVESATKSHQRVNPSVISKLYFACPPLPEQQQIANFLDHETAKIDRLIEKQQQLIELLKEKRQAVISHAVTKGLNPNAPLKPSGVEWLGDVPEHWEVSSLGYYASISTGATPDRTNTSYWNGDIPWVKTGEVNYQDILETEEHISLAAVQNTSVKISPPGTLLMAMYGQGVTRGRVAILGIESTYNQACAAITLNSRLWNKYLLYYFQAAYHAIRDGGNETSQMNLNADIVGKFKITVPPLKEQNEIIHELEPKLVTLDKLVAKAFNAIELIQERRTALISATVTGKIDVRNWRAPEPCKEVEEVSA